MSNLSNDYTHATFLPLYLSKAHATFLSHSDSRATAIVAGCRYTREGLIKGLHSVETVCR